MSIPIPYALEYSSTMTGSVVKLVQCDKCASEFVYQMERSATETGTSVLFVDNKGAAERASSRAQAALLRKLERGIDVVHCPVCGWYQVSMIPKARKGHRQWMLYTGACITIGLIPVVGIAAVFSGEPGEPGLPPPIFLAVAGTLAMFGVALMLCKVMLSRHYDPNSQDVEVRKRLGQDRATLRKDFEERIKAQQGANPAHEGQRDETTADIQEP
jgi:hypothetical protein